MNKRRNILFLIAIFLMLLIKAARAQDPNAGVDWNNPGDSIEDTWHGVATTGLVFAAVIGGLLTALRIRATRALQQSGQGGPQQLGLSQVSAKDAAEPSR